MCLLAAAAAVVSFTAQYRLVYAIRQLAVVAGLEAAIPDPVALVFACLRIALALPLGAGRVPGRRRPRRSRPAPSPYPAGVPRKATKTARFLILVTERHGSLASIPLDRLAGISAQLAPRVDRNAGAASEQRYRATPSDVQRLTPLAGMRLGFMGSSFHSRPNSAR